MRMALQPILLCVGRGLRGGYVWVLLLLLLLQQQVLQQEQHEVAAQVLGIDLGSEFIKAAVVAPGKRMELLLSSSSSRKIPNAISFVGDETRGVAEDALSQAHKNPSRVFVAASLFLGKAAEEIGYIGDEGDKDKESEAATTPSAAVAAAAAAAAATGHCNNGICTSKEGLIPIHPKRGVWPGGISAVYYPYQAFVSPRGGIIFAAREDLLLPPELLVASVLSHIRQAAAKAAGLPSSAALGVVITIPCIYNQRQRAALRDSVEIAGFKLLGFVSSGAAAGVQHALDKYDAAAAAAAAAKTATATSTAAAADNAAAADAEVVKMILNVGSSTVDAAVLSFKTGSSSSSSSSSSNGKQQGVPQVSVISCSSSAAGGGRAVDVLVAEALRQWVL